MNLNSELINIKGIGEKTVKLFHKLDLYTVRDLLYYFPKDYEKYDEPKSILNCKSGGVVTIRAKIPYQNMELRKAGRLVLFRFFLIEEDKREYINNKYKRGLYPQDTPDLCRRGEI